MSVTAKLAKPAFSCWSWSIRHRVSLTWLLISSSICGIKASSTQGNGVTNEELTSTFWVWFLELLHTGSISLTGAASLRVMHGARKQASSAKLAKLLKKKGNPGWISRGLLLLKVAMKEAWSTTWQGVHNQGWRDIKEANYYLAPPNGWT